MISGSKVEGRGKRREEEKKPKRNDLFERRQKSAYMRTNEHIYRRV